MSVQHVAFSATDANIRQAAINVTVWAVILFVGSMAAYIYGNYGNHPQGKRIESYAVGGFIGAAVSGIGASILLLITI